MAVWNHFTSLSDHRYVNGREGIIVGSSAKTNKYGTNRNVMRIHVPADDHWLEPFGEVCQNENGQWWATAHGDNVEYHDLGKFPTALKAIRALVPYRPW